MNFSIVIPAKNEALGLAKILPDIIKLFPDVELIVVDDGSTDNTAQIAEDFGAIVVRHPYSKGNGASIKSGARQATKDVIVFMDADGQHKPEDIVRLMEKFNTGYDMVVGARSNDSQASLARLFGNGLYNYIATKIVGHKIEDLTSGFRIVKANLFKEFLYILPNGFSYPTTITMAFFRAGYSVCYIPIVAEKRLGKSHLKISKDGIRFLLIIFKIGTLYSPLKLFLPCSLLIATVGFCYYAYTFIMFSRFTNMSALLFSTAILVFLMGLISEQITALMYVKK